MSRPRIIALLLALVTLFAYLPATRFDFLNYDDDDYVTSNPVVQNGLTLAGIKWAFTTGHASNWHPLTWLSHMTDCELFKLNAGGHHLLSILFHSANAALLFIVLLRLTEKIWPSAFIAALFAWHPVHVESVAWVAERKDVLSTFFALLTLLNYVAFMKGNSRRHFWLAVLFFALGLMAKPMLVTLPFVFLLLDFWMRRGLPLSRAGFALWLEKTPFFLLTAISSVITFCVQHSGHAVVTLDQIPVSFRLENAAVAPLRYVQKIFWPENLAVIYPVASIPLVRLLAGILFLVLVSVMAWRCRNTRPYLLVGWLWFLGTLVPVIGLVQVGSASMADRYTYIPAIGIFLALAFGLNDLGAGISWAKKFFPVGACAVLGLCLLITETQLGYWRNSETLFRHACAVNPNSDIAHHDLGTALVTLGRTDEALAQFREAVRLNPARQQTHFNLGILLGPAGRPAEAQVEFSEAIRLDPDNANIRSAAGGNLVALGKYDEALKEFATAEELDPRYAMPHLETARVFFLQGHDARAVEELRAAFRIEPDNVQILTGVAHYLAANMNSAARDGQNALNIALKANELSGHSQPVAFDVLGMAFAELGDFTNAQVCAESAITLANLGRMKGVMPIQHRLELYKMHQPWHESFLATNPPPMN